MNSNIRDKYMMNKIKTQNNIDRQFNKNFSDIKNLIINPITEEKQKIDIKTLAKQRINTNAEADKNIKSKMTNLPYKGIIKDTEFDYKKKINDNNDLIVYTVTEEDKNTQVFEEKKTKFETSINIHNKELKDIYSNTKENDHKKKFQYEHKHKYRAKVSGSTNNNDDLRIDRVEYYKQEQSKMLSEKQTLNNILTSLIDDNIISENLDNIDYDKLDIKELEESLKNSLGDEEYKKFMDGL